jgi:hypothetical protein
MANPRGNPRAMVVVFRNEGKPKVQIKAKAEATPALQLELRSGQAS